MVTIHSDVSTTSSLSQRECSLACESARLLAQYLAAESQLSCQIQFECSGHSGQSVALPEPAVRLLAKILEEMAKGNTVTIMSANAELTTQQAADLLNVSRPFLVNLLNKGRVSYRKVGTHRRLRYSDVIEYKKNMDQKRLESLDQLSELDQKLGLGY